MRSLLAGLPRDSLVVGIENPEFAEATLTNELLFALIEVVDGVSWRAVMPHAKRGWKPPKPMTVPRPWQQKRPETAPKVRRKATHEDMVEVFGDRMRGGG